MGIMVKTEMGTASGWSFVQPFSAGLWIAIAVTLVIWPVIIFLIEGCSRKPRIKGKDFYLGVEEALVSSENYTIILVIHCNPKNV